MVQFKEQFQMSGDLSKAPQAEQELLGGLSNLSHQLGGPAAKEGEEELPVVPELQTLQTDVTQLRMVVPITKPYFTAVCRSVRNGASTRSSIRMNSKLEVTLRISMCYWRLSSLVWMTNYGYLVFFKAYSMPSPQFARGYPQFLCTA